ncbi:hypothetical protein SCHPADRAFT_871321 [Schizopora paradoxa]|uniref:Mediator of RNA polymerase II transcription subunit 19 n=1 Tax=Schizopora paradoxa TaxID=27342 RepID=A0A0H2SDX2_9AGAM|nr:hypothetical protein SCHPADRAFT_871321 [Schizopora paradoxa]
MNIGDRGNLIQEPGTSEQHINAQAGPSTLTDIPAVFLPPPGPSRKKALFESTQDLISRFELLPAYDKYVRPYIHQLGSQPEALSNHTPADAPPPSALRSSSPSALDKGKGKEIPVGTPRTPFIVTTPAPADGGDGDDGDEEGAKGEKKKKNGYRHLIKGIPGKHSTKKDDYLQTTMLVPPKQRITMQKFDVRTQREAFSVSLEGLKGWNINALVVESAQAREDRKKRKELKKLAKQGQGTGAPALTQLTTGFPPPSAGLSTSTTAPTPNSTIQRHPQTPLSMGAGTPRPAPLLTQRSGSRPPGPGPGHAKPATPMSTSTSGGHPPTRPGSADALAKRGKKRELEEEGSAPPPATAGPIMVGAGAAQRRPGIGPTPSSAGSIPGKGAPRPLKKQRTEVAPHGHMSLPLPQQQPTPQGV